MITRSPVFEISPGPKPTASEARFQANPADRRQRSFREYYKSALKTSVPLMLGDLWSVYAGIVFGWLVSRFIFGANILGHDRLFMFLPVAVVVCLIFQRTYPLCGTNPAFEFRAVVTAVALAFVLVGGFCVAHYIKGVQVAFIVTCLVGIPTAIISSCTRRILRKMLAKTDWWGIPVVFVGHDETLQSIFERLKHRPWLGYRPVGYVGPTESQWDGSAGALSNYFLGSEEELATVGVEHNAYVAVIDEIEHPDDYDVLLSSFPDVYLTHANPRLHSLWLRSVELAGFPCQFVQSRLDTPWHQATKRLMDISVSLSALLVASPFLLAVAMAICVTSRGPAVYRQRRLGKFGGHFWAWKFRTMVSNADEVLEQYLQDHPELQEEWDRDHKLRNDPRVTRIGQFLRKTSLDEIPQLWNVLRGDMSLVGPRPIVDAEISKYDDNYIWYSRVTPGLTGLWQISGRNNTTYKERVGFDAYYVINWSLWLDAYIIGRTFKTVLLQEGAF